MGTSTLRSEPTTRASQLAERFLGVRRRTEALCAPLALEDYLLSVTADTSPPKWHLAHTSWFFEQFLLKRFRKSYESFNPEFDFLFNSYYKRLGAYLVKEKRGVLSRPALPDVLKYRELVTRDVLTILDERPGDELFDVLELGVNHEEQHQELLLMDIKRNFFENPLRPAYTSGSGPLHGEMASESWCAFDAGLSSIGVPRHERAFAFDNERDRHRVWLEPYALSTHLVTNDEFVAFVEEGGYHNPRFWLSDGWELKEREGWEAPLYWEKSGQTWWSYTLAGMMPLDFSAPVVHVSYYEASAFALWRKARLPTEFEWEHAARLEPVVGQFLEEGSFAPEAPSETYQTFSQLHGATWEWTASAYGPYPRWQPLAHGLQEYNGKFMVNQQVLRGGSCVTPERHYRPTYRNFYYPHNRWQFAGVRLAKDLP